MAKKEFRARLSGSPAYPERTAPGGARRRRLVVSIATAAALSGGFASCSSLAAAPYVDPVDAGLEERTGGVAVQPDAGQPDAGEADAGPADLNLGGGAPQPDVDAGLP